MVIRISDKNETSSTEENKNKETETNYMKETHENMKIRGTEEPSNCVRTSEKVTEKKVQKEKESYTVRKVRKKCTPGDANFFL